MQNLSFSSISESKLMFSKDTSIITIYHDSRDNTSRSIDYIVKEHYSFPR